MAVKKHLWLPLTLMLIVSIAMVNVPVQSVTTDTRLFMRESPPGEWIPAKAVGEDVWVTVDIQSPVAWDDTADGIVGYEFSVHVDPDVLEPINAYGATVDYFLFDFTELNGYSAHNPKLLVEEINKTTGDIKGIGELIFGFEDLGVGAGGNSSTPYWYGWIYGLVRLRFKSKTATGYTPIEITDAVWVDVNETKHAFDVVDDGQYNQPPVYLTVESTPFDGIDFTVNATAHTTNTTVELQPGTYDVAMPASWTYLGDLYYFSEWEDASTNPVRSLSITSNMTIIANYTYGGPPLEANLVGRSGWREHAHFDLSKHGNVSVPDAKGTPGYQTLFAKIKNIGEGPVTVKAEFYIYKGDVDMTLTNMTEEKIEVDQIVVLTVDFAGADGYPWENADLGIWRVEVKCWYLTPYGWEVGAKVKTFKFAVVE